MTRVPAAPPTVDESGTADESVNEPISASVRSDPRWPWRLAEVVVAVGTALLFAAWSLTIDVNPVVRVGQVSGLAALQLRFAIVCVVIVAVLLFIELRLPRAAPHARAIGCAAVAGLSSGLVAGGIVVALNGTPWGLSINYSDTGWMQQWVETIVDGQSIPAHYPPLPLYALAALQDWGDQPFGYAFKVFEIVVTALYGPAAYLMWRLTLAPLPALAIGVVTMVPFIEPFKPYTLIVLVMLMPLLIKFLDVLRRCSSMSSMRAIVTGAGFGAGFGVLFLTYSGWFVWGAVGAVVAVLVLLPWRTGLRPALLILGSTLLTFVAVAWVHIRGLLSQTGAVQDAYMYFDTDTDPAYIAMWRDDMPGDAATGAWPPLAEFAGVGVFTLLLIAGLALAIGLGWRRTVVIGIGLPMVSAWLLRQYFASQMYDSGLVRLYPRTTMFILLGLLLLGAFAIFFAVDRIRDELRRRALLELTEPDTTTAAAVDEANESAGDTLEGNDASDARRTPRRVWRAAPVALLLIPLMFTFASTGSATADRFMPAGGGGDRKFMAWISHNTVLPDGTCPRFAPDGLCPLPRNP